MSSEAANQVPLWSVPGPSDLWPTNRRSGRARRPHAPAVTGTVLDPHNLFCTRPHNHTKSTEKVALLHASSLSGNRRDAGSSPHLIQALRPGMHSIHSLTQPKQSCTNLPEFNNMLNIGTSDRKRREVNLRMESRINCHAGSAQTQ